MIVDHAALKDRVVEAGGDPDCLHCRLSMLVSQFVEAPDGAASPGDEVIGALVQIAGDGLAQVSDPTRKLNLYVQAVQLMGTRCGITAGDIVPGEPTPLAKLH